MPGWGGMPRSWQRAPSPAHPSPARSGPIPAAPEQHTGHREVGERPDAVADPPQRLLAHGGPTLRSSAPRSAGRGSGGAAPPRPAPGTARTERRLLEVRGLVTPVHGTPVPRGTDLWYLRAQSTGLPGAQSPSSPSTCSCGTPVHGAPVPGAQSSRPPVHEVLAPLCTLCPWSSGTPVHRVLTPQCTEPQSPGAWRSGIPGHRNPVPQCMELWHMEL